MKHTLLFVFAAVLLASTALLLSFDLINGGDCRGKNQSLQQYLHWDGKRNKPLIMAHRMAPLPGGYAENSLQALKYTYGIAPCAIQEMDVRMSKDSVLMMLHDSTLNRTTTGKGNLNSLYFNEIRRLDLKDEAGNILKGQQVPTLQEILKYVSHRMVVALDMKPGTDPGRLLKVVHETATEGQVVIICYTIADAVKLNKQYPALMLALGFNNWQNIADIEASGLPFNNIVALTPAVLQEKKFYDKIHSMGIMASASTYVAIDKLPAGQLNEAYAKAWQSGCDIICTDSLTNVTKLFW